MPGERRGSPLGAGDAGAGCTGPGCVGTGFALGVGVDGGGGFTEGEGVVLDVRGGAGEAEAPLLGAAVGFAGAPAGTFA